MLLILQLLSGLRQTMFVGCLAVAALELAVGAWHPGWAQSSPPSSLRWQTEVHASAA